MDLSGIQKELKSALYERLSSPFIGCFMFSWLLINYKSVLILILADDDVIGKINLIEAIHNNYSQFLINPLLLTLLFILIHPLLSVVIFWWQEKLRDLKRRIKLSIENASSIPMIEYRKLESLTSQKLTKHNEMVLVYEDKIEKISAKTEQFFYQNKELKSKIKDLTKRLDELEQVHEINAQIKEESKQQRSTIDNLKNEIKKLSRINDSSEETAMMLSKQFELINEYHKSHGLNIESKKVVIDIPHLREHSIDRLIHEITSLGITPVFDGDTKVISILIPFYVDTAHIEKLAENYRSDFMVL